jgi:cytochrome P450
MSESEAPLPPGRDGPPLLGETLVLLRDPFGFVERRAQKFGPVFRTRVLGRPTAVITGPDATAKFIDGDDVQRAGAMPANIQTLFGGRTLPVLDGDAHRTRKQTIMAAFALDAVAGYVPRMARLARGALARWAAVEEIGAVDELRRLAIEGIAETMVGLEPGPALDAIREDYGLVLRGLGALPIPLPGTAYWRAKGAVRRVLATWRAQVARHQAAPQDDGLSRIVAARSAAGAAALDDDAIAREVHHLILAGLIVWAWCARTIIELDRHPGIRARLLAELESVPADGLSLEALERLPYLDQVASEVRRVAPVVPLSFGKARRTFTFAGHTVPAGWMVLWAPSASHTRPEIYPAPERFDPERFAAGAAQAARHPHAFAPNGAGDPMTGHKCAGYLFAPTFLKVFTAELVRGYTWILSPDQNLTYDWTQAPPPPRDGLRVRIRPR